MQDCIIPIANALEILHYCTEPLIFSFFCAKCQLLQSDLNFTLIIVPLSVRSQYDSLFKDIGTKTFGCINFPESRIGWI